LDVSLTVIFIATQRIRNVIQLLLHLFILFEFNNEKGFIFYTDGMCRIHFTWGIGPLEFRSKESTQRFALWL